MVIAIVWAVWLERSRSIFEGVEDSLESIWARVRFWVATWVHVKEFKSFSFSDMVKEWRPLL